MKKIRLYEIAKELGVPAKVLIEKINKKGYSFTNNLNAVEVSEVDKIKKAYYNKEEQSKKKELSQNKNTEKSSLQRVKNKKTKTVENTKKTVESRGSKAREAKSGEEKTKDTLRKTTRTTDSSKSQGTEKQKRERTKRRPSSERTSERSRVEQKDRNRSERPASSDRVQKQGTRKKSDSRDNSQRTDRTRTDRVRTERPRTERPRTDRVRAERPRTENSSRDKRTSYSSYLDSDLSTEKTRNTRRGGEREKANLIDPALELKTSRQKSQTKKTKNNTDKRMQNKYNDGSKNKRHAKAVKNVDYSLGINDNKRRGKKSRHMNDIARAELEKKDLNFAKKTPSRRKRKSRKQEEKESVEELVLETKIVELEERMTVADFCTAIDKPGNEIVLKLMNLGVMASINQYIDFEIMQILAEDSNVEIKLKEKEVDHAVSEYDYEDSDEKLQKRAPVVTVMGHVDHGKTSLLDAIRSTSVSTGEAGGITQHIGASEVKINGEKIVLLDTPGHEAFTSLRARGVQLTDIAILVVAADDGVMPQTIEAVDHAKAADVPIIVAINKIDKPGANPDRVMKELSENGILLEDWGGDVVGVKVSAKQNENIEQLLEMVILVSEMMELKANPNRTALGTVIEANLDKGRGPVATVLVQNGTLKISDPFVCGTTSGRVRAMYNDKGKTVKKAGPSTAVEVIGMSDVAMAGDKFFAIGSDKEARKIAEDRTAKIRSDELARASAKVTLEAIFDQIQQGKLKTLNLIIKADVHGSIEAIKQSLAKIENDEVKINIQHANIGAITESDIMLATASNTIVLGFNVRPSALVLDIAKKEGVEVKTYTIIYELLNDVEAALQGMLAPKFEEHSIGEIEVRATFRVPGGTTVAGCYVNSGMVNRNSSVRLLRDGVIIFDGKLSSLKRFKDDVREVKTGYECGLAIDGYNDIKENDKIEVYENVEIKRTL